MSGLPPVIALQDIARSTAEGRFGVGGISFADPWFLALIPVAAALLWRGREARRHATARVPSIAEAVALPTVRTRLVWLPVLLRIAGAALALIALSRPLEGRIALSQETQGIDIALLVDRSTSMEQRASSGAPRRFDIVKDVVADFARRRMTDTENARDNVALFGFARFADLIVPFTLDVDALEGALKEVDVEMEPKLDGTGIGSALLEAVGVLDGSQAKSRVVVLLTDGEETVGFTEPMQAAKVASDRGVRIYTVYAGPRESVVRMPFGGLRRIAADVGELPDIAEMTGGRFFHAESKEELEKAYASIEELERTPRREERFAERYDLYPRFLLPGLLLYVLSWVLGATFARRLP